MWIEEVRRDSAQAPLLGFQSGIEYDNVHIQKLTSILIQAFKSPEYLSSSTIPAQHMQSWREAQGEILMKYLPNAMSDTAGGVLNNITSSRTRISQILSTGKVGS